MTKENTVIIEDKPTIIQLCSKVKESITNNSYKKCPYLKQIETLMGLSKEESIVFSLATDIHFSRISKFKCHPVELIRNALVSVTGLEESLTDLLNNLLRMGLINIYAAHYTVDYVLNENVAKSLLKNKKPKFESISIDLVTFIGKLESTLMSFRKNKSKTVFLFRLLNKLEKLFNKLPVCKFSIEAEFSNEEKVLYYLIIISIMKSEKTIGLDNYCDVYFNNYSLEMSLKKIIANRSFLLIKEKLIFTDRNKFNGDLMICSTSEFIDKVMGDDKEWVKEWMSKDAADEKNKKIMVRNPEDIDPCQLYYNEDVKPEIDSIQDLLMENRYQDFLKFMHQERHRLALTILLSGPPGTGKTETALQWARFSGRVLHVVDYSEMHNKYVGESEKAVRKLFADYRISMQKEFFCPILFLNEADGLISKRLNVQQSIDQSNNTIQNILLDELENFNGILVATSNHLLNMDEAFMRRFLYKIELSAPSADVRMKILKNKFRFLTDPELEKLNDIPFTGAQIENILRKRLIYKLQFEKEIDVDNIKRWLANDISMTPQKRGSIGFAPQLRCA
jgi:hypothetical protein